MKADKDLSQVTCYNCNKKNITQPTSLLVTKASKKDVVLDQVPCIRYPPRFRKDLEVTQTLIEALRYNQPTSKPRRLMASLFKYLE